MPLIKRMKSLNFDDYMTGNDASGTQTVLDLISPIQ